MFNSMFIITIIIIALFFNLSYGSPRIRNEIAKPRADKLNYKLTKSVFPEHYTLKISPHFNNSSFTGYVKILIHVKKSTDKITLHQKDLNITKEKIYLTTMDNLVINITNADKSGEELQEFYTITFPEILNENTYYLHIPEFYGSMNQMREGFYEAHYTDEKGKLRPFAMSSFESLGARLAFPCFDEPSFRAKFKIYIVRSSSYHSVSNTKLIKSKKLHNNLYEDEFEDTVPMPTYILAFVVSDMKLSTSPDSSFYRVIARPGVLSKGYEKDSLKLSIEILQALETYLNVNYTLNKMDQATVPDKFFAPFAMENWGLIIYREGYFLITPQTSTGKQLELSSVIAHEIAHQWFGNLVTMEWWRYLWLKEGFAQFLQNRMLDIIKPEWKQMEKFSAIVRQEVLDIDLSFENRDMNQDAGTRIEISHLYDQITYGKASLIIHMIETIMTPNIFRRGLTNYLQDRAFQSAIPIDLYRNLQKSLDNSPIMLPHNLNIKKIMSTWDSHEGYPLVYVQRDYNKSQEVVKLTQCRYIQYQNATSKSRSWYIPINYASKRNPNFKNTQYSNWLLKPKETITIKNLKRDDWLILNKQAAYYYRVNYDLENWKLIAKALKENYRNIHVLNRAQIIDDSFNLANLKKIDFSVPLEICSYLHQEDYYIIHFVFLFNIYSIEIYIVGTSVEQQFQNYVIQSLKRSYRRLGYNHRVTDTQIDKLHRIEVVNWMCKFNYSQCRANTWKSFDEWRKNNKSLDVDLTGVIMCNAIRRGSEDDWNYVYEKYKSTDDIYYGRICFQALACTENVSLLLNFIDLSLNPSEEYTIVEVVSAISRNGFVGVNASRHYVKKHLNALISTNSSYLEDLLDIIISYFSTQTHLVKFIELFPKNITESIEMKQLFQRSRVAISRKQKSMRQIYKFFQSHNPYHGRSDGNLCQVIPNIFAFILYGLIIFVMFVYN